MSAGRKYVPRRAGKRWLEGAPEHVLDCFYFKSSDHFDIFFAGSLLGTIQGEPQDFAHVYIMGMEVNPDGAYCSFELNAYQAAQYRYAHGKRRVKWNDLPGAVRQSVANWAKNDVEA